MKVTSFTEPAAGIADYPQWTLVHGHQSRQVRILDSKRAGQNLAVRLEGIDTMDAARMLTGAEIQVPLFIESDTKVKVDTRDGSYLGRIND